MDRWLKREIAHFAKSKRAANIEARQRYISLTALGIDFDEARTLVQKDKVCLLRRISRLIERERIKGANGHWSYDLNRHIALKQLRDSLASELPICFHKVQT